MGWLRKFRFYVARSNLGSPVREIRELGVQRLGKLGGPQAVELLVPLLLDPDTLISEATLKALQEADFSWSESPPARSAVPLLREALHDKREEVRQAAVKGLAKVDSSWPMTSLDSSYQDVRQAAIAALSMRTDPDSVEQLVSLLGRNKTLRFTEFRIIVTALVKLREPRVLEPLLAALQSFTLRETAAAALVDLRDARAIGPLMLDYVERGDLSTLKILKAIDENWDQSESACSGISQLLTQVEGMSETNLARMLHGLFSDNPPAWDQYPEVQSAILGLFDRFCKSGADEEFPLTFLDEIAPRWRVSEVIRARISLLSQSLHQEHLSLEERLIAVRALGAVGGEACVESLKECLESNEGPHPLRLEVVSALGRAGNASASRVLWNVASTWPADHREPVVEALAQIGDDRAFRPLLEFIKSTVLALRDELRHETYQQGPLSSRRDIKKANRQRQILCDFLRRNPDRVSDEDLAEASKLPDESTITFFESFSISEGSYDSAGIVKREETLFKYYPLNTLAQRELRRRVGKG